MTDSLTAAEDELFREWAGSNSNFVADGATTPAEYESSGLKLLFILKEVNDLRGGGWDLRELLREGTRKPTWTVVTRWIRAIRALPVKLDWADLRNISTEDRRRELSSIAAMNLKKLPGGHTADPEQIAHASSRNADYLLRQFLLYLPDLAVCYGSVVKRNFAPIIEGEFSSDWRETSRGIPYLEYLPGKFVIEFSHPEARVADNLLHYGLVDAVAELLATRYHEPRNQTERSAG